MFSRKDILFSEVALVSVHCNCLIGCIMIAGGYRSWNTANTAADICLLVESSNKDTEKKCKICSYFFISHLAFVRLNLGHWKGGSLTHPMLITTLFEVRPEGDWEPRNEVGSQSLENASVKFHSWTPFPPYPSITILTLNR